MQFSPLSAHHEIQPWVSLSILRKHSSKKASVFQKVSTKAAEKRISVPIKLCIFSITVMLNVKKLLVKNPILIAWGWSHTKNGSSKITKLRVCNTRRNKEFFLVDVFCTAKSNALCLTWRQLHCTTRCKNCKNLIWVKNFLAPFKILLILYNICVRAGSRRYQRREIMIQKRTSLSHFLFVNRGDYYFLFFCTILVPLLSLSRSQAERDTQKKERRLKKRNLHVLPYTKRQLGKIWPVFGEKFKSLNWSSR